jgi:RimJ/RimL family protein N-acetyltransferase
VAGNLTLSTRRLSLVCLTASQLECCLSDLPALEAEFGISIARDAINENVTRAVGMKLLKMAAMPLERRPWQTYWLIVVKEASVGAGFIGFKGLPNAEGETEIGYGLAPEYQGKGYMTEAVRALCDWAFSHPLVSAVTATTVMNPASNRVLEKAGAQIVSVDEKSTNWKILPSIDRLLTNV